jgi:hypothetical protein
MLCDAMRCDAMRCDAMRCDAQELANAAWALAAAARPAPHMFDAIGRAAAARLDEFKPQELARLGWAFAAADARCEPLFGRGSPFARRCDATDWRAAAIRYHARAHLRQLQQWTLWRAEVSNPAWPSLSAGLRAQCGAARDSSLPSPLSPPRLLSRHAQRSRAVAGRACEDTPALHSRLQSEVVDALRMLRLAPREEHRAISLAAGEEAAGGGGAAGGTGGYAIDAAVEGADGLRVAVEVDGPSHFIGRRPTGATALKRRQLRHLGWHVLAVPHWEWAALDRPGLSADPHARAQRQCDFLSRALVDMWTTELFSEVLDSSRRE